MGCSQTPTWIGDKRKCRQDVDGQIIKWNVMVLFTSRYTHILRVVVGTYTHPRYYVKKYSNQRKAVSRHRGNAITI